MGMGELCALLGFNFSGFQQMDFLPNRQTSPKTPLKANRVS